jgi:putative peptide zinc metalloprotease protein
MRWNRQTIRTAVLAAALLLVLLVPWQGTVRAPAVLGQARSQVVYTPRPAQLVQLMVRDGQQVEAGATLVQLSSPDLDYQLASARQQVTQLQRQVDQQPFDDDLRALGPALGKRLETAQQTVAGLLAEQARLSLRAPFAGRVVDIEPGLDAGEWLKAGEPLLGVAGGEGARGDAFVDAAALARLAPGQNAEFVARLPEQATVDCRVGDIDRVNIAAIDEPYVASVYGGGVPSLRRPDGTLVPLDSTFRVRLDDCRTNHPLRHELPGKAVIRGETRSLLGRFARWLGAIIRRDVGF